MGFIEMIIIGIGLSMDAFAVSITNGLSANRKKIFYALSCGVMFGLFQGAMPCIGYALGMQFADFIKSIDHYIALVLLSFIGIKMIYEAQNNDEEGQSYVLSFSALFVQGFATSVDALAVGVSFAALMTNITAASAVICLVTFVMSSAGFFVGSRFGNKLGNKAEVIGGIILIILGLKIFLEHTLF